MKPAPSDHLSTDSSLGVSWVLGNCNKFHSTTCTCHPLRVTIPVQIHWNKPCSAGFHCRHLK